MTNMCETFNCLPQPGGLYDQDAALVTAMRFVRKAQSKKQEKDAEKRRSEMQTQTPKK